MQAQAVFLVSLAAFVVPNAVLARISGCVVVGVLALRAATVYVLARSTLAGKLHKRLHRRAMVYWSWWPCFDLLVCAACAFAGGLFGHYLWYGSLQPYFEIAGLQPYKDINPQIVPG